MGWLGNSVEKVLVNDGRDCGSGLEPAPFDGKGQG